MLSLPAPTEQWDLRKTSKPHSHGPCLSEGYEGPGGQWLSPAGSTEVPVKESGDSGLSPEQLFIVTLSSPKGPSTLSVLWGVSMWVRREVMPGGLVSSPGLASRVCSLSPSHHYPQGLQMRRAGCPAGAAGPCGLEGAASSGVSSSALSASGALQARQRPLDTHQVSQPDCGHWSTSPAWS